MIKKHSKSLRRPRIASTSWLRSSFLASRAVESSNASCWLLVLRISTEQLMKGLDASRKKPPSWSLKSRPKMVSGDAVPSWVKSIPGPKYHPPCDSFKKKQPAARQGARSHLEST